MKKNSEPPLSVLSARHRIIRSMMRIYDRLYRSGNYLNTGLREYLLHVVRDISSAYETDSKGIEMQTHIEDCEMDSRTVIFIALIANEIITNSLKYAFAGRNNGIISIEFRRLGDGTAELVVSDNGIGSSNEFITAASAPEPENARGQYRWRIFSMRAAECPESARVATRPHMGRSPFLCSG